jgi:uncharacterized protein YceK
MRCLIIATLCCAMGCSSISNRTSTQPTSPPFHNASVNQADERQAEETYRPSAGDQVADAVLKIFAIPLTWYALMSGNLL